MLIRNSLELNDVYKDLSEGQGLNRERAQYMSLIGIFVDLVKDLVLNH